ncbi:MAG: hypothetical protein AUK47_02755 [Deltaproteobacteria bacterium CG2_30_63_29]|nr:MAG: hypothetical protein AUK47_02755 [Deltaproteobacteria bacterium CG2_30_63_29]PIW02656.1 MAG: hypothetical protein COW42_00465 [Deltaproteobacteria bacterium CG17_big_fil_post_rev_8_21_14_2_50_63_7]PJB37925.1 MAG: hypothetical protein CO108_19995 [Deltaproteobacteria bacterium CG_4_9_14_3_um_filter_63_12]
MKGNEGAALKLVCPRCRRLEGNGSLYTASLVTASNTEATLGEVGDCSELRCSGCVARYPVVEGIPVVFPHPGELTHAHNPPWLPLDLGAERLAAMLSAFGDSALAELCGRLGRYLWAGFNDWLPADEAAIDLPIHAKEVCRWIGATDRSDLLAVLGSAVGREAYEVGTRPVLLVDAHLASLLTAKRLSEQRQLEFVLQAEPGRWQPVSLSVPEGQQTAPLRLLCCDLADPPLLAGCLPEVLLPNVIDSVTSPYLVLGQSFALRAEGANLTLTTPFAWKAEITPMANQLPTFVGTSTSEEALLRLVTELSPAARLIDQSEFRWAIWGSSREQTLYRSAGYRFS